jgi:hypothetical protein
MAIPLDKDLYQLVKQHINTIYKKPSAYRSGAYVKLYKQLGGKYKQDTTKKTIDDFPLARWFLENWDNYNISTKGNYPVYRPTFRISDETPKTVSEISKKRLKQQSELKQEIKGKRNLPKF